MPHTVFAVSDTGAVLIAAGIAALVSLVTGVLTFQASTSRLKAELRTEFAAEEAIRALLSNPAWRLRSFDEISRRLRGFEHNELRRLLVRAGAVAFDGQGEPPVELWGRGPGTGTGSSELRGEPARHVAEVSEVAGHVAFSGAS